MMAAAPRAAVVSWHVAGVEGAIRCPATDCLKTVRGGSDAGDLLIVRDLVEMLGQHSSPVRSNRWRLLARHLRRRWW